MNNPYAKLGGGALDQELFKKQSPPPEANAHASTVTPSKETRVSGKPESRESESPGIRESGKPGIRESGMPELRHPGTPGIREKDTARAAPQPFVFNVNEAPSIKETFLITDGEYEGMEDMKLQLRRLLDMKASKQDIIRCAVQHIIEDFRKHPEASIIVSRLQHKKK